MLGEPLSEGIYVWEYLEFPPDSQLLILPTNTWTRSQTAGIVGDGVYTGTPGSLHVVESHANHDPKVWSLQVGNFCFEWLPLQLPQIA